MRPSDDLDGFVIKFFWICFYNLRISRRINRGKGLKLPYSERRYYSLDFEEFWANQKDFWRKGLNTVQAYRRNFFFRRETIKETVFLTFLFGLVNKNAAKWGILRGILKSTRLMYPKRDHIKRTINLYLMVRWLWLIIDFEV